MQMYILHAKSIRVFKLHCMQVHNPHLVNTYVYIFYNLHSLFC